MEIVQLDIQGFRSLKNVSWRPGDLNVVIGPNGSGKSNLLKMLELISASAQARLRDYVQLLGGIKALSWDGQDSDVVFRLTTSYPGNSTVPAGPMYQVNLKRLPLQSDFVIQPEVLTDTRDGFKIFESSGTGGWIQGRNGERGVQSSLASPFVTESLLSSLSTTFMPWVMEMGLPNYRLRIGNWAIYHDVRTDIEAPMRFPPVSRQEQKVSPNGHNLINVLHTLYTQNRDFEQDIDSAMSSALGADYNKLVFPPDAGDQRVQMRVRWKTLKREQSTADLSDGTLRFLFLMTVLASPNPPPLIAIDEPETGLHPSMLPIIAEFAVEAATRTQVIFTTHSDQFLDAFRDARPTTTVAKWENGETTLTTLDDSELEYWLKDYSLGKLFRSGELENLAA